MPAKFIPRIACACRNCGAVFYRRPRDVAKAQPKWCSAACFYNRNGETKSKHPYYQLWAGMRQRCNNPREKMYYLYGGRGIRVCPEWEASFEQFVADMGERPTPNHTIERKNVNGDYCAANCCWATPKEQAQNRRDCRYLTYDGRTQTIAAWAAELGLRVTTLRGRIKYGWSLEEAFRTPPLPHGTASSGQRRGPREPLAGTEHPNAKLSEAEVREIRRRSAAGESRPSVARDFGISPGTVKDIARRRLWKHLED